MSMTPLITLTPMRQKVIELLQIWRSLESNELKVMLSYDSSDRAFRLFMVKMEKLGIVESKRIGPRRSTCYFIGRKNHSLYVNSQGFVSEDHVFHDVLNSKFMYFFIKGFNVANFDISPSLPSASLDPDAILYCRFRQGIKSIAVEMELTRKSIKRYVNKFKMYSVSESYDLVLYVFNDKGIYSSYKRSLCSHFQNLNNCNVLLLYVPDLSLGKCRFDNLEFFAFGEDLELSDIFVPKDIPTFFDAANGSDGTSDDGSYAGSDGKNREREKPPQLAGIYQEIR